MKTEHIIAGRTVFGHVGVGHHGVQTGERGPVENFVFLIGRGRQNADVQDHVGQIDTAVEAMKRGAYDFITKPFDHDEMLLNVARLLKQRRLEVENARLRSELGVDVEQIVEVFA